MAHRLNLAHIEEASAFIDPVFLNTPQFVTEPLSTALGVRVVVKVETVNPVRSFKGRGAEYLVSRMASGQMVMTASAGNLGQAMAYACRKRGVQLIVYASINANPLKVERMRALGAEVVLHGRDFDEAKAEARRIALQRGVRMVEDSLDVETGEGAGTIGVELARFQEPLDAVIIALGNGALACGVGLWLRNTRPQTAVIAVQARGAPAMVESWRSGSLVRYDSISTIADGIGVRLPIPECVQDMRDTINDALLVSDESMIEGMRLAHRHLGLVLEPSGAAGIAAVLENRARFSGQTVATILCGGNVTTDQMASWLRE
ncbi:MAG: threonine/serine dehydratase [Alphaproteobacteria bacterium]